MTDEFDSSSIVSEVDERLDDIFGKNEGESAPLEGKDTSQLGELRGLILDTDREKSDEHMDAVKLEIKKLEKAYAHDNQVLALLKIMSLVAGYMKVKKVDIHPETNRLLDSVFRGLQNILENNGLSTQKKRTLVEKEINNFNEFKVKISSKGEPPGTEKRKQMEEIAAGDSKPATPPPEQSLRAVSQEEFFEALEDVRGFMLGELAALKGRVDDMKEAFTSSDETGHRISEEFESFKDRMNGLGEFSDDLKNLRNYIEEFASQKGRMDELKGLSDDLSNMGGQLSGEFARLKEQVNELKDELTRLREDLNVAFSEIEDIKGSLSHAPTESAPAESSVGEEEAEDVEGSPEDSKSALDWHLLEKELIAEGARQDDDPQEIQIDDEAPFEDEESEEEDEEVFDTGPLEREPEPETHTAAGYFLFQMGGKRYAVREESVIKVSKAGRRLLKKASEKGGLTMNECRRMFSDVKRGIEPNWEHLSPKDLEKTTFHLLSDDRIDGLLDTKGGGMLFLGSGEKRSILFTDQMPKKEWLSREDKVKSMSNLEYVCAAIHKKGNDAEKYLILDADKLCKRLRVSIPAPFTKI